ncbi:MAG TPA: hypothetical protein VM389_14410, partial [Phycisphaerae bacterium]|nr:hypothetical protein [Phycisphaerae bacterium]
AEREAAKAAAVPPDDAPGFDLNAEVWAHMGRRAGSKDPRRAPGYHPSQMERFCPRADVLGRVYPKPDYDPITPELQTIFDWGTAWHWVAQNRHFGPMGILWGTWRCNGCAREVEGFMPAPCAECYPGLEDSDLTGLGGWWEYQEPALTNDEFGVVGQSDGILIPSGKAGGRRVLLEIKTINEDGFKRLRGPAPYHVFQVSIYLWLSGLDRAWVCYYSKGKRQERPKCFRMSIDEMVIEDVKRRITMHRRALKTGQLCGGVCRTNRDSMALKCSWRTECFDAGVEMAVEQADWRA